MPWRFSNLKQALLLFGIFCRLSQAQPSQAATYDYPYADPWVATVSSALIQTPPVADYQSFSMPYGTNKKVPLRFYANVDAKDVVFLIPGLGGDADDTKANFLADTIYRGGHNVLVVPNNFSTDFQKNVSRTGYVGVPSVDAVDMRNLLAQALGILQANGVATTKIQLVGYSLGALLSAFVAEQESQQPTFNLTKTVLINSPVSLWHGIQVIDQYLQTQLSWQATLDVGAMALGMEVSRLSKNPGDPGYYLYLQNYSADPDDDFQYLIGEDFSASLKSVAPPSVNSFEQYIQQLVLPALNRSLGYPNTVESLANEESLTTLSSFLATSSSVFLMHNQDDFLLEQGDLDFLSSVFSARLTLYPHGGHIGNIWYPQNQTDLLGLLN